MKKQLKKPSKKKITLVRPNGQLDGNKKPISVSPLSLSQARAIGSGFDAHVELKGWKDFWVHPPFSFQHDFCIFAQHLNPYSSKAITEVKGAFFQDFDTPTFNCAIRFLGGVDFEPIF